MNTGEIDVIKRLDRLEAEVRWWKIFGVATVSVLVLVPLGVVLVLISLVPGITLLLPRLLYR